MIFGGILIALIIMVIMISMAVGKKADKKTRIAALIALGVMILTVIICIIFAFTDTTVVQDPSRLIVGEPLEVKKEGENSVILVFLVLFLAAIFTVTAVLAMKENRKQMESNKNIKSISNW
ncbi:MAG: hypothetical protein LBU88_02225 [Treponema sp.]|jgi:cytochrome bd-type quinol oxidase subunit 2|nr:hypothetical protein [Treponema sp.]